MVVWFYGDMVFILISNSLIISILHIPHHTFYILHQNSFLIYKQLIINNL
jgi:hypothetical protein